MFTKSQKNGHNHKKRAKPGNFPKMRLNGHARLKTGRLLYTTGAGAGSSVPNKLRISETSSGSGASSNLRQS